MSEQTLYEKALDAIRSVFNNQDASLEDTLEDLQGLVDELYIMIEIRESEINGNE